MSFKNNFQVKSNAKIYFLFLCLLIISIVAFAIYMFHQKSNFADMVIISVVSVLIVGIFIYNYWGMINNYIKILFQLEVFENAFKDVDSIEKFKQEYSNIGQQISQVEYISDIWWEFCETLIIKRENNNIHTPQSFNIKDNPITVLKNTAQVELYVNETNIIDTQTHKNVLETIPSALTGLGLVGTFTAIAFALFNFNLEQIDTSIQSLLSGLSVKFISSLVGIISSLIFLYIFNTLFTKMRTRLHSLQIKLNKLLPRRTTESYLCNILEQSEMHQNNLSEIKEEIEEQSNNLKSFLTDTNFSDAIKNAVSESISGAKPDIVDAIDTSLGKLDEIKTEIFGKLDTVKEELINTLNNLNSGIASSISGSMNNSLNNLNINLGNAISSLSESMETFKKLKQQSSADIMEKMISELRQCMTDMREDFQNKILDGSGDTITSLQTNLKDASSYLANVQSTFTGFMEKLMEQQKLENETRNEAVSQAVSSTVQQVSDVNKNIQQCIDNQSIQLNNWLNTIKNYIDEIHKNEGNIKENYSSVVTGLNNILTKQSQTISNLTSASDKIITSSNNLEKSSNQVAIITDKTVSAATSIKQSLDSANELAEHMKTTISLNRETLINLQNVVVKLNNELGQNIDNFANKSKEFQEKMLADFLSKLNDVVFGMQNIVEEQTEMMEKIANQLDGIYK